jgi:hypothetical protein
MMEGAGRVGIRDQAGAQRPLTRPAIGISRTNLPMGVAAPERKCHLKLKPKPGWGG